MLILNRTCYKPTQSLRRLAVLEALSENCHISQFELAGKAGVSVAMINKYLRDMAKAGHIEYEPVNARSFNYNLTPAGETLRQGLFDQYCVEIVQGYTTLKQMIRNKLAPLKSRELLRIVLFGASETCEVVVSALRNTDFRIVALLDSDPAKQGLTFLGMVISPPMVLATLNCQVVIITSFSRQEEIGKLIVRDYSTRKLEIVRL